MYYVYLLTNKRLRVIYTGVTNNLIRRVHQHKSKLVDGFTKKYNLNRLIYYESYEEILQAITREKEIKGWIREKKNALVSNLNPKWEDLYYKLL